MPLGNLEISERKGLYFLHDSHRCSFLSQHSSQLCPRSSARVAALEFENLALRHQIGVLRRSSRKRPKLTLVDRLLWVWLSRIWSDWRSALAIVEPETVAWPGICAYRELRPYQPASSWHANRRFGGANGGRCRAALSRDIAASRTRIGTTQPTRAGRTGGGASDAARSFGKPQVGGEARGSPPAGQHGFEKLEATICSGQEGLIPSGACARPDFARCPRVGLLLPFPGCRNRLRSHLRQRDQLLLSGSTAVLQPDEAR